MEIELTQGKVAQIDDADWPLIAGRIWYTYQSMDGRWYAQTTPPDGDRSKAKVKMHNLILGQKWVDHIDSNGLNNTRSNLRPCTNAQNQQNTGPRAGSSRFKGISWVASKRKWRVAFRCDGQHHSIGYFSDESDAARAYNEAVLPLAGEFAKLNPV